MVSFSALRQRFSSPRIEQYGLILRLAREGDFEAWKALRDSDEGHLTRWEPKWRAEETSLSAFKERVRRGGREARTRSAFAFFVFRSADLILLGGVTLSAIRLGNARSASIGYWIGEAHTRKGYGAKAVRSVVNFGLADLGLNRINAACQPGNVASKALLCSVGFKEEGIARDYLFINGEWRDHCLFAVTARDLQASGPCSPVRVDEAVDPAGEAQTRQVQNFPGGMADRA